jgi:hypothetical protein
MNRIPLVIVEGRVNQLPVGDTIFGKTVTNDNASPITLGQLVYATDNDHVDLADPTTHPEVVGIVIDSSISPGDTGSIQTDGIANLTGLIAGTVYFLGAGGSLTSTIPIPPTRFLVRIGRALSTTELELGIQPPIGL